MSTPIPLKTGWNLITLPVIPTDTPIATVLAPIAGKYSHVWAYDNSDPSDPWKLYDPTKPEMSDLSTIEPDKGYYIKATEDCTLTVNGEPITVDRIVSLQPGWNLVGWTTIVSRHASDALSGLSFDPQLAAWAYDVTDTADHWKSYALGEPGSDLVEFAQGKGYWVYVSNATNLAVPAPAPQDYHYDSQGRRQGSIVIYDGANQLAKYDDSGNLLVGYFQGPGIDNPISMTRDGQTYYYHTDALGSVTELTDSAGDVVQSYRYDAFGLLIQQSGNVENAITYTGRESDKEAGLCYYRTRYYDPVIGRFLSPDPIGYKESANLFLYTENKPVNFIDPVGLFKVYWNADKINPCCSKKDADQQRFEINIRILAITDYLGGKSVGEGLPLAGTCCANYPWWYRWLFGGDYYASVSFSSTFRGKGSCIQKCGVEHEAVHVEQCERDKPEKYNAAIANDEENRKYEEAAYTVERNCLQSL